MRRMWKRFGGSAPRFGVHGLRYFHKSWAEPLPTNGLRAASGRYQRCTATLSKSNRRLGNPWSAHLNAGTLEYHGG